MNSLSMAGNNNKYTQAGSKNSEGGLQPTVQHVINKRPHIIPQIYSQPCTPNTFTPVPKIQLCISHTVSYPKHSPAP